MGEKIMRLPKCIEIIEVGPRDGFQNIKTPIASETKVAIIESMIEAGIGAMEITSFVHPKAIPQMADADVVVKNVLEKHTADGFRPIALVPNLKGAQKAYNSGLREVTYVISASENHNLANINRTRAESLAELKSIVTAMPDLKVRLAAATSFGCPFLGKVKDELVLSLINDAVEIGVGEIILCDTIGVANPQQVYALTQKVRDEFLEIPVGMHLHDTRGMALANTLAAMEAGITIFETSVGGLGGCPFAPGAAGNAATEDLLNMLQSMDIQTNVNLAGYLKAVYLVRDHIQKNLTSHMVNAYSYDEN